jgi:N4-gp56 family major capsid protein
MARTTYTTGSNETVKRWNRYLFAESIQRTTYARFIVEGDNKSSGLITLLTDLQKDSGDRIRSTLLAQLTGDGIVGDTPQLRGNEESLTTFTDDINIDLLAHAVDIGGKMSRQRVAYDVKAEAVNRLADWAADRMDTVFFNHLCGFTAETRAAYNANNTIVAPDAAHILRAGASNTTDQAVGADTAALFDLPLIDRCIAAAKTFGKGGNPIAPAYIPELGGRYYVMFVHSDQVTNLYGSTYANGFSAIQRAIAAGQEIAKNPIFTDVLGVYRNTLLVEAPRITRGVHSTSGASVANTRRAVFAGAQAAAIAFAGDYNDGSNIFSTIEQNDDYDRLKGVGLETIYGLKKMRFNSADFASIAVTTYTSV